MIKNNKDMKTNKYNYLRVIQFNCGYGWEDCSTYEKSEYSQVRNDLKEYRLSGGGCYRVINRRVLNN